jgi:hypothetical protein
MRGPFRIRNLFPYPVNVEGDRALITSYRTVETRIAIEVTSTDKSFSDLGNATTEMSRCFQVPRKHFFRRRI